MSERLSSFSLKWCILIGVICSGFAKISDSLGSYKLSNVTVSGVSSGGYMAVQMHISHSSIINGAAVFAGGPFYCAEGTIAYAEYKCMEITLGLPQTAGLVALTLTDESLFLVDKTSNLKDDNVFIFSGKFDSVINPLVVQSLETYYQAFVPKSNIVTKYDHEAEHCMPTLDYGEECLELGLPYIGKCGYDGAGQALKVLYGPLKPAVKAVAANLLQFDQKPFIPKPFASLEDTGYIYVPTSCQKGAACRLHMAIHGCVQTLSDIGNAYAEHSGYNEWAESNDIVVLYPYAAVSEVAPLNPNGCWDWWGYTGPNYGVQTGTQVQFLRALIHQVSGL